MLKKSIIGFTPKSKY